MNNKNLSIKNTNAIFLAMVLITGTIAAISPSFIIGVNAQGGDSYHQMYNKDNNYEEQPREYQPQYQEREYNSYKPSYEKNSYDTHPSYGNDNYQPREYSSYQQDYKQEYPKYVKENYKPKKDNSVSINKLNCINNNVNINGNNTGDINIGNKGRQGYSGGYSSAAGGYGSGEGYGKQGKGSDCIINNNNNNINIIGGGGNVTDGEEPKPTCGECFSRLTQPLQNSFNMFLNDEGDIVLSPTLTIPASSIRDLCTFFNTVDPIPLTQTQITAFINMLLQELPGGSTIPGAQAQLQALVLCLIEADIIVVV